MNYTQSITELESIEEAENGGRAKGSHVLLKLYDLQPLYPPKNTGSPLLIVDNPVLIAIISYVYFGTSLSLMPRASATPLP